MCWWTSEEAGDGRSVSRTALLSPVSSRRVASWRAVSRRGHRRWTSLGRGGATPCTGKGQASCDYGHIAVLDKLT